ncbi:condensation domain-containing protein [Streptomyces sp. Tu6071]|uniref:condensation domain-containing protein n=1 Tax=Streptomyces sp. Tu6071 TaxID=355249 RepID=UPI0003027A6B|nr:condensation domain-containing protein [Streptomyces sp. Tu6071]
MSTATGPRALPLTKIQEEMWTAYRIAPGSSAYNVVMPLRVRGPLDPAAMAAAVTAVGLRQELLRSVFTERDGRPVRYASASPFVRLEFTDLSGTDEAAFLEAAREAGARPFRLEDGPFRVVLLRRAEDDWALVTSAHHIVSDFTSRWLLVRDLLDAYTARLAGTAPAWRPLRGSYGEHAEAEGEFVASERGRLAAEEWRAAVAGSAPAELPLDRPRPAVRSLRGDTVVRELPGRTAEGLAGAAHAVGVTPFAYLLAAFQALTHRWTGQDDFLLGVPASSRSGRGTRDLIGCFLNTIPVRAEFAPATTFRAAAERAGERVMRGMLGVRCPAGVAFPGATLFRAALFLVQMDRMEPPVPNVPPGSAVGPFVAYGGVEIALVDVPQQEGQLDVLLRIEQTPGGVTAVFSYDTDVLDRASVERLADGYAVLLAAAVDDPDTRIADVSLSDAAELEALLALGAGGADGQDDFGGHDDFDSFETAWSHG